MDRESFESDERLRRELDLASHVAGGNIQEPEKTTEEYDRELTEKLRQTNPELFRENPEVNIYLIGGGDENKVPEDSLEEDNITDGMDGTGNNPIIEESHEDEDESGNKAE